MYSLGRMDNGSMGRSGGARSKRLCLSKCAPYEALGPSDAHSALTQTRSRTTRVLVLSYGRYLPYLMCIQTSQCDITRNENTFRVSRLLSSSWSVRLFHYKNFVRVLSLPMLRVHSVRKRKKEKQHTPHTTTDKLIISSLITRALHTY